MRIGEALALHWADVDLEAGTLRVCRTLTTDRAGRTIVGERTKGGKDRTIPFAPELAAALRAHRAHQREIRIANAKVWQDTAMDFTDAAGAGRNDGTFRDYMRAACKAADVPPLTPHGLRHTAASLLAEQAPIAVARDMLGHNQRLCPQRRRRPPARITKVRGAIALLPGLKL